VTVALVTNLAIGMALVALAGMVASDQPRGRSVVRWVLERGQRSFGEDWNVHPYLVAVALMLLGLFFLLVGFSIFARRHDFWVIRLFS
jgi:hypothetical protein